MKQGVKRVDFLYVRHGRTEFNRDRIIQGADVDSPLAPESLGAVRDSARALGDVDFARCYVSPLGRARQTASILLEGRGLVPTSLPDLREFDFGTLDGKPYERYRLRFSACFMAQDFSRYGGEAGAQVRARVRSAFARMYEEAQDGDNVLVVAHGALFRYVLLEFGEGPALVRKVRSETIRVPNAGIALVTGDESGFFLRVRVLRPREFRARAHGLGLLP